VDIKSIKSIAPGKVKKYLAMNIETRQGTDYTIQIHVKAIDQIKNYKPTEKPKAEAM